MYFRVYCTPPERTPIKQKRTPGRFADFDFGSELRRKLYAPGVNHITDWLFVTLPDHRVRPIFYGHSYRRRAMVTNRSKQGVKRSGAAYQPGQTQLINIAVAEYVDADKPITQPKGAGRNGRKAKAACRVEIPARYVVIKKMTQGENMFEIGMTLLVLNFILYIFIIREIARFRFATDPISGTLILLFSGLYILAEVSFGPLIGLENHMFAFETEIFLLAVGAPFVLLVLAGTAAGVQLRNKKYGKPEKKKRKQPLKEMVRWITRKKPSDTLKNAEL